MTPHSPHRAHHHSASGRDPSRVQRFCVETPEGWVRVIRIGRHTHIYHGDRRAHLLRQRSTGPDGDGGPPADKST